MERLTVKRDDGRWAIANNDGVTPVEQVMKLQHILARLAAYEDRGLEPEEIDELELEVATLETIEKLYDELGTLDHLRELVQAEKDGRLVVLPCKVGDKLFILSSDSPTGIEETRCKRVVIANQENGPCAKVIAPCTYDDWGGAYRVLWPENFGKTVFLTHEEAARALEDKTK